MRPYCAAVILAALSFPCAGEELTPQAIRAMIADVGADAAVQRLDEGSSSGNAWAQLTDEIESGEAAWLDLAPLLKPAPMPARLKTSRSHSREPCAPTRKVYWRWLPRDTTPRPKSAPAMGSESLRSKRPPASTRRSKLSPRFSIRP